MKGLTEYGQKIPWTCLTDLQHFCCPHQVSHHLFISYPVTSYLHTEIPHNYIFIHLLHFCKDSTESVLQVLITACLGLIYQFSSNKNWKCSHLLFMHRTSTVLLIACFEDITATYFSSSPLHHILILLLNILQTLFFHSVSLKTNILPRIRG